MPLVVDFPLNTAIVDLDDALRRPLRRDPERRGFGTVEITFDGPSEQSSGNRTSTTVNLFAHDLREAPERAEMSRPESRGEGQALVTSPPLRLELTPPSRRAGGNGEADP